MDRTDQLLLDTLKQNSRASASELSRLAHLSVPAVTERMRKLEQSGVIEQYSIKLNRAVTGHKLTAFVFVTLEQTAQVLPFRTKIVQNPLVLECHHIAGQADYLLKVATADTEELEDFLMKQLKVLSGVRSSNTIICLSTLKEEFNV